MALQGLELLKKTICQQLDVQWLHMKLMLSPKDLGIRSELFNLKVIEKETNQEDANSLLEIKINTADWRRLVRKTEGHIESLCVD